MDNLRGHFSDDGGSNGPDFGDDDTGRELPPLAIGQDERRMQVRAYNLWASLLDDRQFPSVDQLDPESLPDFGPFSVLLDFSNGIEDPRICYLGDELAAECGGGGPIRFLSDVPSRSLLTRITDHYMQILANQAPIGFEAEFVNQRTQTVLYRGILLPFSSDGVAIDFIYGVINWKELADQQTTDELMLEIDQALEARPETPREVAPLTEWADGPADTSGVQGLPGGLGLAGLQEDAGPMAWPEPAFGDTDRLPERKLPERKMPAFVPAEDYLGADLPSDQADDLDDDDMELADWLASARELAQVAKGNEDRSRHALYAAIGRAYDFSIAAAESPDDFHELVVDAGLTMQDRAPMTPVVKLVFGGDYDKTRLTEYASALGHAHRVGLERGALAAYLLKASGGLKGIVTAERRLRREDSGKPLAERERPREALARKLRKLDHGSLDRLPAKGSEFTLLVARRLDSGEVVLLGEVEDVPLLERAARYLIP
jgi:hypothetical protein